MSRCHDCNRRLRGEHFVPGPTNKTHPFDAAVCKDCRPSGADAMEWMGMEYVREAPPVVPILMFSWCLLASIITIALLLHH